MSWDSPVVSRSQLVLFSERLDEVLAEDHSVRRLVEILDLVDWSHWEYEYRHAGAGRPPIHPKVMCGVILFGLMRRIRSSRQLEEALQMRLDFRWLAEGRSIDHTTICRFRRDHGDRLKELFVQIILIARQAGIVSLTELAFDGTRIRANNRRSGKLKVADLQRIEQELQAKFDEHNRLAEAADEEQLTDKAKRKNAKTRVNLESRLAAITKAMDEIERLKSAGQTIPARIPTTDTDSRITPNKEGGFAPNYTPLAAVDSVSDLIVSADVIASTNEKVKLPAAIADVQEQYGVKPERVLADTIFNHGPNLAAMEEQGVELYCPMPKAQNNPAIRDDPTQAVPEEKWDQLPTKTIKKQTKLSKEAFVYDCQADVYHCPQGKQLTYKSTCTGKSADGTELKRRRYLAASSDCQGCPLADRCFSGKTKSRQVSHDQFQSHRERLSTRMESEQGRETYDRRMKCERPFGVIKQVMGVRQFLLRGLAKVKQEWHWLAMAFNLKSLMRQHWPIQPRAGPSAINVFNSISPSTPT